MVIFLKLSFGAQFIHNPAFVLAEAAKFYVFLE